MITIMSQRAKSLDFGLVISIIINCINNKKGETKNAKEAQKS